MSAVQLFLPEPSVAQRPEKRSAGQLRLSIAVEPGKLVLGQSSGATVRVRAAGAEKTQLEKTEIRLRVNVGRFLATKRTAAGEVTADYEPPSDFFPQVAIIAAVARNDRNTAHAWKVLPLWGTGKAVVWTKPRASVKVRIGKSTFGPVMANKHGRAAVRIIAPPGIKKGLSAKRAIALNVPPMNRIVAIAQDETLPADGSQQTRIRIYAVTDRQDPARDVSLKLIADRGRVSAALAGEAGVYLADYTPPDKVGDGRAVVTVMWTGHPVSRDRVAFRLVSGSPARIDLRSEPERFVAGQRKKARIHVEVFDAAGNAATGEPVMATDFGQLARLKQTGAGQYQAELSIPNFFDGRHAANVRATLRTRDRQALRAQTSIALGAGVAERIEIQKPPEPIVADGKTAVAARLRVSDAHGNAVTGLKPDVFASEGSVGPVIETRDSGYEARYIPALRRSPGRALLRASVEDLTAEAELQLLDKAYLLSLSLQLGYLTNLSHLSAPYFSAELSWHLPFVARGLSLLMESGYYFCDRESDQEGLTSSLSVIPLIGSIAYRFWLVGQLHLYVAAGAGAYFTSNRITVGGQPGVEQSAASPGFHGSLGVGYRIGPGQATLQVRYVHAQASAIEQLSGNIAGFILLAGYQLGLF